MHQFVALLVMACVGAAMVNAHVFKTGNCPNVDVMDSFDYDKFQGRWYAIEKSNTLSSCMHYNFQHKSDGSKIVEEKYRFFGVRILDLTDFSQIGQLSTPDVAAPAKMLVQFPFSMNPFAPAAFWVMSTDYENYAAIWSCRRFLFGHFQSAMILSRNDTLDRQELNKLRSRFEFYGIDKSDFSVVDQSDCAHSSKTTPTTTTTSSTTFVDTASDFPVPVPSSSSGPLAPADVATPSAPSVSTTIKSTTTGDAISTEFNTEADELNNVK